MTARTLGRLYVATLMLAAAIAFAAAAQPATRPAPAAPTPAAQPAPPNALQGFSQNRNEPVKIESARLEVRDKDKKATFLGDVHLTQGDTTLTCKTLVVHYEQNAAPTAANPAAARTATTQPAANGQSQIRKLEALGDVVVVQKDQTATGSSGIFDMKSNTITLVGNVVVTQGPNVLRGERLTVDMTSGVSTVEPARDAKGHPGRVEGLFLPAQKGPQDPAAPKDAASPKDAGGPKDGAKPPSGPMKLN
jgi:lipopolysaccharide export system protein LptA